MPKQFREVAGAPLVVHAVRAFLRHPGVGLVVLVVPLEVAAAPPEWLSDMLGDRLHLVAGGATRTNSALNGLTALPPHIEIVLVHDGARPNPDPAVIDAILVETRHGRGAIAAIPVSDTIKEASAYGTINRTVPRERLWRAQTPQGFPRDLLARAYARRDPAVEATDEATLVEAVGGTIKLVPDSPWNIKVTTALDLSLAEWLLRGRP